MPLRILLATVFLLSPPFAVADYQVIDLGVLGGLESRALDLNDQGVVVGESDTGGGFRFGFLYRNCAMNLLTLGGIINGGAAYGINQAGLVVGTSNILDDFYMHAFVADGGQMTDLGLDGSGEVVCGLSSAATAINDAGVVVGWRDTAGANREGFLYRDGTMQGLGTLGGSWSEAYAINNRGVIVGASLDIPGRHRAFLYREGSMQDLGTLGGVDSEARAVNDAGLVAGWADDAASERHAVLWDGQGLQDLGTLGGAWSEAYGLGETGEVVGWSRVLGGESHAFLFRAGSMVDLNGFLPAGSGWTLLEARAINASGQIVGQGVNPQGERHAFLLSPVPLESCADTPIAVTPNQAPVADAGPDQTVALGTTIILDGSASRDPDGTPGNLHYAWTQVSGPIVALVDAESVQARATLIVAGIYRFALTINDRRDASGVDEISVTAVAPSAPADSPLRLLSPTGGEAWKAGRKATLRWTAPGLSGRQRLSLWFSADGGSDWTLLTSQPARKKTWKWKIPSGWATEQGRIRICVGKATETCDASGANFRVF